MTPEERYKELQALLDRMKIRIERAQHYLEEGLKHTKAVKSELEKLKKV